LNNPLTKNIGTGQPPGPDDCVGIFMDSPYNQLSANLKFERVDPAL